VSLAFALERIIREYPEAKGERFPGHVLGAVVREGARREVKAALGPDNADLLVKGGCGRSAWAEVPWIAAFDPRVTRTVQRGTYVVYLFHARAPIVHLSLVQGTLQVQREFGPRAAALLAERGAFLRRRLADLAGDFPVHAIDLGSDRPLPSGYAAGHVMGFTYALATLPHDAILRRDLRALVAAYRTLTLRGGLDAPGRALPGTPAA
jgi:5-methylcytosine-specific restriction enzyme A